LKSENNYDKLDDSETSSQLKEPILESENKALVTKNQKLKEKVSVLVRI